MFFFLNTVYYFNQFYSYINTCLILKLIRLTFCSALLSTLVTIHIPHALF